MESSLANETIKLTLPWQPAHFHLCCLTNIFLRMPYCCLCLQFQASIDSAFTNTATLAQHSQGDSQQVIMATHGGRNVTWFNDLEPHHVYVITFCPLTESHFVLNIQSFIALCLSFFFYIEKKNKNKKKQQKKTVLSIH